MPDSTSRGITYPLAGDLVRNPNVAAKLASDLRVLAQTADDAVRQEAAETRSEVGEVRQGLAGLDAATQAELAQQRDEFITALDGMMSAYDVAVADGYVGTIPEWLASLVGPRGPEGPYGGTEVTDPQVASYVTDGGTETRAALAETMVARGTVLHDVRDYGAVGDNTTDDSAAFQAAIAAAKASRGRAYAWGTFRVDQPVLVDAHADFSNAIVNYHGTGAAFTITGFRLEVSMPTLHNRLKSYGGGWDDVAGSIGVLMLNCNGCEIHVKFVENFEEGLTVLGANGGCAYNNVILGWLFNNKRGQVLTTDSTTSVGYSNQNTYIGGRISMHAAEQVGYEDLPGVPGTAGLVIGGTGDGGPNSNLWLNTCLEGATQAYAFDIERGRYNKLVNVRLEYGNAVRFGPGASRNEVTVGYYTAELTQVRDDPGAANDLIYPTHAFLYDKHDEQWRNGDAFPWMRTSWASRSLYLGNGSSEARQIRGGATAVDIDGSVRPMQDGTYDLGSPSLAWRSVNVSSRVTTGNGIDFRAGSNAPAADGLARLHARMNSEGKMELRVRWPDGNYSVIASEP